MSIIETIGIISAISIIIPFGVILMNVSFYRNTLFNISFYILVGVLFEIYQDFDLFIIKKSNQGITNIYTLIETLFVAWIFFSFIKDSTNRKIILLCASLYTVMWFGTIAYDSLGSSSSIINGGSSLTCIIWGVLFFFQLSKENELKYIRWKIIIGGAFLFYFVISAGVFSFTQFFSDLNEKRYWIVFAVIHFVANVGLNSLLALGLYQCRKQSLQA